MRVSDERHHSDETSGDVHMRETRKRCGHLHPHRSDQHQTSTREFPHLRGVNKGRGRGAMCSRTSSTVHARPADATLGAPNLGTRGSFQIWAATGKYAVRVDYYSLPHKSLRYEKRPTRRIKPRITSAVSSETTKEGPSAVSSVIRKAHGLM